VSLDLDRVGRALVSIEIALADGRDRHAWDLVGDLLREIVREVAALRTRLDDEGDRP
jgi:hypothetical protein